VNGGQILDRSTGECPVKLVQRPFGWKRRGALDQRPFELAPQKSFEPAQLLPRGALVARIILGKLRLGLHAQAERPADALDIHAQHARALAPAEGGDGQSGQITQGGLGSITKRGGDLLTQRVQVDLRPGVGVSAGLGDAPTSGLGLGGPEEETVKDQLEHPAVLG
jgi:hypothetical protein